MDGYELLKRVKLLYPEVTRLILSGFTDEKTVFKSIYNNLAKLFITKPWKRMILEGLLMRFLKLRNYYIIIYP